MTLCAACRRDNIIRNTGGVVATGGGVATAAAAGATAAGFTSSGIAAGSFAAATQASIGNVVAGSVFATLQSLGATGTIAAVGIAAAPICIVGAGVVGGVWWFKRKRRLRNQSNELTKEELTTNNELCDNCGEPISY